VSLKKPGTFGARRNSHVTGGGNTAGPLQYNTQKLSSVLERQYLTDRIKEAEQRRLNRLKNEEKARKVLLEIEAMRQQQAPEWFKKGKA
jgi:hypothetical protein